MNILNTIYTAIGKEVIGRINNKDVHGVISDTRAKFGTDISVTISLFEESTRIFETGSIVVNGTNFVNNDIELLQTKGL